LTNPSDNTPYTGGERSVIELKWEDVGVLGPGEEYVIYVGVLLADGAIDWIQAEPLGEPFQGLSWVVPAWMHGVAPQESGRNYRWYVQVERVTRDEDGALARDDDGIAVSMPLSPPSTVRAFSWQ
jgi:hypothetical protein